MTTERQSKTATGVAERRRKVAAMDLRHVDQLDIAQALGVDRSTVSRDITALRTSWRVDAAADVQERIAREDAELDSMERDCAIEFAKSKDRGWLQTRLAIKDRRASLLGLDAPKRTEISGRNGGPIDLAVHPDWVAVRAVIFEELEDDPARRERLARRFLELHVS
jgi:hypothetical protein